MRLSRLQVRAEEVIFEIRKRIGMRSVGQDELQALSEVMLWQRSLRRSFHEGNYVRPQ